MNKYSFKIIYHIGNSINIKTKVKKAELTKMSLGGHIIKITDTQEKQIYIRGKIEHKRTICNN